MNASPQRKFAADKSLWHFRIIDSLMLLSRFCSKLVPSVPVEVMDLSATGVAFTEVIQRSEGTLRFTIVRQSFEVDFSVVIQQTEAMHEASDLRFVVSHA
jgi:hypothetical protein